MSQYKILEVEHLTDSTFRIRTERPQATIKAGQCFNVGVFGAGVNREYSMYSAANAPFLDVLIKEVKDGTVSPLLKKLQAGDAVEIDGPYGEFCLHGEPEPNQPFLFLATGTGIAPFHSFVKTFPNMNYTIVHGIRSPLEQYDSNDYLPGRYIPCISKNTGDLASMRVTDYLRKNKISPDTKVYLCGNRNMIVDAFEILRTQGIPGDNLFTEVFF